MKLRGLLLMMFVALWRPCDAQTATHIQQQLDSVTNPPLVRNEALHFREETVLTGTLCEDDAPSTYRFRFVNTGNSPLVITRTVSSCGCVRADYDPKPVLAGAQGEISATYNPKDQAGVLNRHIYVYTNQSSTRPAARLTLSGNVLPTRNRWSDYRIVLGSSLRAKRSNVSFGQIRRDQERSERIECVNTGNKPLRLAAVVEVNPKLLSFHTEPEVIAPGAKADLVVTINAAKQEMVCGQKQFMLFIKSLPEGVVQKEIGVNVEFTD